MKWAAKLKILKTIRVKSRTQRHPDTGEPVFWEVSLWSDGKIKCSCPAYRKCHHILEATKLLKEKQIKKRF